MNERFEVVTIPFEQARAFRAAHAWHSDLVEDRWDAVSDHMGLLIAGALAATFRVVHTVDGRLPVCKHYGDRAIHRNDVQVGRFLAERGHGTRDAFAFFMLDYFVSFVRDSVHCVYVALLKDGAFSMHRFKTIGFVDTEKRYVDERYPRELAVLVKEGRLCGAP